MHAFRYRCVASERAPPVEQQQQQQNRSIYRSSLINAQAAPQARRRFSLITKLFLFQTNQIQRV